MTEGLVRLFGLSDPPTQPTGFARVSRELFDRLALTGRYDIGYMSTRWIGSARNRKIVYYCAGSSMGQAELADAAADFAGEQRFVLWTLMDPWQMSWLAFPDKSPLAVAHPRVIAALRRQSRWVMHFTVDGEGPNGGPPRWVEQYADAADYPVAMSDWGRRLVQSKAKREVRFISHAVDVDLFKPMDKGRCREIVEGTFARALVGYGLQTSDGKVPDPRAMAERLVAKRLVLDDKFVVLCVMANRPRKYWWDVLRAFRALTERVPRAALIGVCGSVDGQHEEGALPLGEIAADLGLRIPGRDRDPNVWLIATVEDNVLPILNNAADVTTIASAGEGFGLPQLEAHACGRACVIGDYSASSELIVNRREGIPPRNWWWEGSNQVRRPIYDHKEFASRLAWASQNPAWLEEVGQAGLEQARSRSWDVVLPQWERLLAEAHAAPLAEPAAEASAPPRAPGGASEEPPRGLGAVESAEHVSVPGLVQGPPRA